MGLIRITRYIFLIIGLVFGGGGIFFAFANNFPNIEFFRDMLVSNPGLNMTLSMLLAISGSIFFILSIIFFVIYYQNKDMYWLQKYCEDAGDYVSLSFLKSLSKRIPNPEGYIDGVSLNGTQVYSHQYHSFHPMCIYNPKSKTIRILSKLYSDNRQIVIEISHTPLHVNIGFLNRDGSGRKFGIGIWISPMIIAIIDHEKELTKEELGKAHSYSKELIHKCKKNPNQEFIPHDGIVKLVIDNKNLVKVECTYANAKNMVNEMDANGYSKSIFDKLSIIFNKQPKQVNDYYKLISETLKI